MTSYYIGDRRYDSGAVAIPVGSSSSSVVSSPPSSSGKSTSGSNSTSQGGGSSTIPTYKAVEGGVISPTGEFIVKGGIVKGSPIVDAPTVTSGAVYKANVDSSGNYTGGVQGLTKGQVVPGVAVGGFVNGGYVSGESSSGGVPLSANFQDVSGNYFRKTYSFIPSQQVKSQIVVPTVSGSKTLSYAEASGVVNPIFSSMSDTQQAGKDLQYPNSLKELSLLSQSEKVSLYRDLQDFDVGGLLGQPHLTGTSSYLLEQSKKNKVLFTNLTSEEAGANVALFGIARSKELLDKDVSGFSRVPILAESFVGGTLAQAGTLAVNPLGELAMRPRNTVGFVSTFAAGGVIGKGLGVAGGVGVNLFTKFSGLSVPLASTVVTVGAMGVGGLLGRKEQEVAVGVPVSLATYGALFKSGEFGAEKGFKYGRNLFVATGKNVVPAEDVFYEPSLEYMKGKGEGERFPTSSGTKESLVRFEKGRNVVNQDYSKPIINQKGSYVEVVHATSKSFAEKTVAGGSTTPFSEDTGIFVAPKGEGSPYFLGVGKNIYEYKYSANPFANIVKNPSSISIHVESVRTIPESLLKTSGFVESNKFLTSKAGESSVFITKRSELGTRGGLAKFNKGFAGTSEVEAVLPKGSNLQMLQLVNPKGNFFSRLLNERGGYNSVTFVEGYAVPLKEYNVVKSDAGFGVPAKKVFSANNLDSVYSRVVSNPEVVGLSSGGGSYLSVGGGSSGGLFSSSKGLLSGSSGGLFSGGASSSGSSSSSSGSSYLSSSYVGSSSGGSSSGGSSSGGSSSGGSSSGGSSSGGSSYFGSSSGGSSSGGSSSGGSSSGGSSYFGSSSGSSSSYSGTGVPPPVPFVFPPFSLPDGSSVFGGGSLFSKKPKKFRYAPSLTATVFNVKRKGSAPKSSHVFSGLELRPIFSGMKKLGKKLNKNIMKNYG